MMHVFLERLCLSLLMHGYTACCVYFIRNYIYICLLKVLRYFYCIANYRDKTWKKSLFMYPRVSDEIAVFRTFTEFYIQISHFLKLKTRNSISFCNKFTILADCICSFYCRSHVSIEHLVYNQVLVYYLQVTC